MDENWNEVVGLDDIPDGEVKAARIDDTKLCIGRADGELFAVDDECPHAGGSLSEGLLDGNQIICPLHAYAFETGTGHCPDDPSYSVQSYSVRIRDGKIQIRLPAA